MKEELTKIKKDLFLNTNLSEIKHYKFLLLIVDEIKKASKLYTKKQQLMFINNCFTELNQIKYTTYIQFLRTYAKNKDESKSKKIPLTQSKETILQDEEDEKKELKLVPVKVNFKRTKNGIQEYKGEIK